jgi:hypothetical protein
MQYINEVKRLQQLAGISTEDQQFIVNEELFDVEAIKKQIEDKLTGEQNLDEVFGALTTIGLALAVPAVIQGIATLIEQGTRYLSSNYTKEEIAKLKSYNKQAIKTGGKKLYTSETAKKIDHFAHWLHEKCLGPLNWLINDILAKIPIINKLPWIKDKNKRHKLAEAIYLFIAIGVGGIGFATHAASIIGVIDAVKVGDAAIDSSVLATKVGLLRNLPNFVATLVT